VTAIPNVAEAVEPTVESHLHPVASFDLADHPVRHHLIGHPGVAGLVDEGQRGAAECVGPLLGHPHPAGVGGDHHDVGGGVVVLDVAGQQGLRTHMVHRAVEETLNLVGVQIHRHDPVRTRGLE